MAPVEGRRERRGADCPRLAALVAAGKASPAPQDRVTGISEGQNSGPGAFLRRQGPRMANFQFDLKVQRHSRKTENWRRAKGRGNGPGARDANFYIEDKVWRRGIQAERRRFRLPPVAGMSLWGAHLIGLSLLDGNHGHVRPVSFI